MSKVIEFFIYGKPTAKGRPRFTRSGRTYTPAKTREAENVLLKAYLLTTKSKAATDLPVSIELTATFQPPKSWSKAKQAQALAGELEHTSRPDFDNLAKLIDGLNGYAWLDDSQIFSAKVLKKYGQIASTHIRITIHERNK